MSYYLNIFFSLMENTQYTSRSFINLSKCRPLFYVQQNTIIALQCNNINNDGREVRCKVMCGDHFTDYLTSVIITVNM